MPLEDAVAAIQSGDIRRLRSELAADASLARARFNGRTLLHVATDWPGHFANVAEAIAICVAAGADVNARMSAPFAPHRETPLHWAASSNDVDALDALLDHGADLEADGAVVGGGTALADAVAFAQWRAAARLVERGAIATLWQAAALGLMDRLQDLLRDEDSVTGGDLDNAFWAACHGGQRAAAQLLLDCGADAGYVFKGMSAMDAARKGGIASGEFVSWLGTILK